PARRGRPRRPTPSSRQPPRGSRERFRDCSRAEHPWYLEEAGSAIRRRRLTEDDLAIERRHERVFPIATCACDRRRFDAGCVDLLHLVGIREDGCQLSGEELSLFAGQLEPRKRGDAVDVGASKNVGHRVILLGGRMRRPAAVAGTWYPASAGALAREVDDYVGRVDRDLIPRGHLD